MEDTIKHTGKVVDVDAAKCTVTVRVAQTSACAGCHSKKYCTSLDKKDKIFFIHTVDAGSYQTDDEVMVSIASASLLKTVLYAYILPLIALLSTFFITSFFIPSEPIQVLASLFVVTLYYLLLYLLRDKMNRKFRISIDKVKGRAAKEVF